ncbi:conserved hypothetical protein [Pediculus humanus corporis]|uniref:General transcription factor 3C polypeptide 5 n=1 Tax=Pediculus humanus subsp. corporis TaxID=121224 RepID=E0VNE6_PEDHC|nr:uncharacterized protein Phum_PHUM626410 [Pediculus humanus corporis]EEB14902.1 conserved hypothetical protein [Pediculus humanus corporis]
MTSKTLEGNNSLVCIHYPGVVKNISNVLETLGGIRTISSTYSEKNRRLELRWRPQDSFCKPTYGSRKSVVAIVLKIKYKKKKNNEGRVLSYQSIGCVTEEYKFSNLCDFQFLPTSKDECIYDKIVPSGLDLNWLNSDAPYFLPPPTFSRFDTVQSFNFSKNLGEDDKSNVIGRLTRKRYGCTKCLTFDNPEVPEFPKNIPAGGICSARIVSSETLQLLKQLFQERPIYSKSAIRSISKVPLIQLKCLLPCVAYYFINGPWRSLWVRFGYDPRKDPKSRIYQTLDYRVRSHLSKDEVKNKRNNIGASVSYKFSNQAGKNISVISRNPTEVNFKEKQSDQMDHIFRPEMVPPSRQCYYQYCDIHVPEVQAMLENLENVDESTVCHEYDGWLPPAMADTCRDIMNKYVSEEVRRRNKLSSQPNNVLMIDNQISSESESEFFDSE